MREIGPLIPSSEGGGCHKFYQKKIGKRNFNTAVAQTYPYYLPFLYFPIFNNNFEIISHQIECCNDMVCYLDLAFQCWRIASVVGVRCFMFHNLFCVIFRMYLCIHLVHFSELRITIASTELMVSSCTFYWNKYVVPKSIRHSIYYICWNTFYLPLIVSTPKRRRSTVYRPD